MEATADHGGVEVPMRGWILPALTVATLSAGGVGVAVTDRTDPSVQQLELAAARDGGTVTLPPRTVRPFSLIGITWPDAAQSIAGSASVRTRTDNVWSGWTPLDLEQQHGPDDAPAARGGTDPLWIGRADGVEVRIRSLGRAPLPPALRLELVNPDVSDRDAAGSQSTASAPNSATVSARTSVGGSARTEATAYPTAPPVTAAPAAAAVLPTPLVGAPALVDRAAWKADESIVDPGFAYTGAPKVMFVHHTAGTNNYTCAQSPAIIRSIHIYHTKSRKWGDIGYNFLVDKCGTVYEGRAGGAELPVYGIHTLGFNDDSVGVVVLGTYTSKGASAAALRSLAHIAAWKLGAEAADVSGQVILKSHAKNRYNIGNTVIFARISAHRDGVLTECPGTALYNQLPSIRQQAAALVKKAMTKP
ncbi:N-acetylmuramoyl-L-alanine amidase [Catenuloplanes sp. NPDC051500]|uniref:N-acetylmuramoyl-L-alanine amidase n=1 Tax=Catenuloplanes sp. NPDC051500 TaxID=3363959 RepID=UPI0037B6EFC1